jgi:hypothetical protein
MLKHINKSIANGQVQAPPSKSYAHRLLIGAALCQNDVKVENIELSNQIINDIIGNETPIEYTSTDISDAADVVGSIIETYQNTADQDNFSLEDLSEEDLEKLESSALAKTILEKLFK